ncbi:MAG TPA: hypothetical protein VMS21_03185 [Methylomirabilota bacterium]|nr:hypothetical protein [Methylomirabilota bacterium]
MNESATLTARPAAPRRALRSGNGLFDELVRTYRRLGLTEVSAHAAARADYVSLVATPPTGLRGRRS